MKNVKLKNICLIVFSLLFVLCCYIGVNSFSFIANAATEASITMDARASVRDSLEKTGIRFTAYIDNSYFDTDGDLKDNTVAGIIVVVGAVETDTVIHENCTAEGLYANTNVNIEALVWDLSKCTETSKAFNAVVYNIPEFEYGTALTARGYIGVYNSETEKYDYVYSSTSTTRSVAQVASNALADGFDDENGTVTAFVDGVNGDFTINGETSDTVSTELAIGQSENLTVAATPSNLQVALTPSGNVKINSDGTITATGYTEGQTAKITAKLGSKTKTLSVTVKNSFYDAQIEDNVLADFNEANYVYGVKAFNGSAAKDYSVSVLSADEAASVGATSGVLRVSPDGNYDELTVKLTQKVTVTDIAGIYFTMKYESSLNELYLKLKKSDGNIAEVQINSSNIRTYNAPNGNWRKICIPYAEITRSFAGVTEISEITFMTICGECTYYIDEIGVISANGTELLSFDDASDINMVYGWFVAVSHSAPGSINYPADKGATTGIAVIPGADNGCPSIFYFKQFINTSNVSKIVLRMYMPVAIGNHSIRVYVTDNNGTKTEVTMGESMEVSTEGFADVEINLSSLQEGTVLNQIEFFRFYPGAHETYYLDSISFVEKT